MSIQLFKEKGGRDIVSFQVERRGNGNYTITRADPEAKKPSILSRLAKVAIAITIFSAASYGEGWINYLALAALFLVYLVAIA